MLTSYKAGKREQQYRDFLHIHNCTAVEFYSIPCLVVYTPLTPALVHTGGGPTPPSPSSTPSLPPPPRLAISKQCTVSTVIAYIMNRSTSQR